MRDISSQLSDLSPSQRVRLLARMNDIRRDGEWQSPIFSRRGATSGELSFAQQRLWFLQEMYPEVTAYNCSLMIRIDTQIEPGILEQALTEIARRHEILRTTFPMKDEQPVQIIGPAAPVPLRVRDLRIMPESERESAALTIIGEETKRHFDLIQGPCWRPSLLQFDEDNHILHVTFHHIVTDGWSTAVFFKEVQELYESFVRGAASPLPELPIQYLDFAAGQRVWLQGPTLQSQLSYWKRQLAEAPPLLQLPTDHPRPAV